MPTKKETTKKEATKKVTAKKETTRKPAKKKTLKKDDKLVCQLCGLVVRVDNVCGCVDVCDLICCGKEMKPRR